MKQEALTTCYETEALAAVLTPQSGPLWTLRLSECYLIFLSQYPGMGYYVLCILSMFTNLRCIWSDAYGLWHTVNAQLQENCRESLSGLYKIPPVEPSGTSPNYSLETYYSRHCKALIFKVYFGVGGRTESPSLTNLHKNTNAVLEFHINIELAFEVALSYCIVT